MSTPETVQQPHARRLRLVPYLLLVASGWTAVTLASHRRQLALHQEQTVGVAHDVARAAFAKDLSYRRWAARQGGVYVPISDHTPPNPHLAHLPHRDVVTTGGARLTLVNPAYMTRQVFELSRAQYGLRGHITSLNPLAEGNRPDAWEEAALRRLDAGEPEVASVEQLDGEPYLRFLGAMVAERACLKCHADQGYREGDVRGGIAISVPLAPLLRLEEQEAREVGLRHLAMWLAGMAVLGYVAWGLRGRMREREGAQAEQHRLEQELMRAQKLEALGRLSGGIAHDFNNLLTPILGHAQLLAADLPEGSPQRQDAEEIRAAAQRAAALTRRLLAFGRQEGLRPEPVDLGEVVAGMAGMLQRLLGENVTLAVRSDPRAPRARCDRAQAEMALVNLALNARDAMPGGGSLAIATGLRSLTGHEARGLGVAPGDYATLEVRDTGHGMAPQVQARLFEPFFTTKAPGRGTGLGLATVRAAARHVGGAVEVESAPGRGTLFRVLLPATEARPEGQPGIEAAPRGSEAVLVVEDDAGVRHLAVAALSGLGYRVREADSPAAALALSDEEARVDLLLSDVVMPGMSGPELWQRLRSRAPGAAVLFMSGYPGQGSLGDAPLLQKPFAPGELARAVRQAIDAGKKARRGEAA
ncbi:MAG: DUF3365 domain-containing protein [Deltaproteobacteria bacterium]|nr:DUF3365 domain-containing protein [Deltaproteobacteria bacterium]